MQRQESTENYLEAVLMIKEKSGMVRSIDIANNLGVTKPSVSVAMKNFRKKGLITVDAEGFIILTREGEQIAKTIYERHVVITAALISIGVSKDTAQEDACRIEHDMSEETFQKFKEYLATAHK